MIKNYTFKYGSTHVDIPVDTDDVIGVLKGNVKPPTEDIRKTLFDSLNHPIDSEPLVDRVRKAGSICLIVSDITRFWMRQDKVVPHLVDYLVSVCGKAYRDITILIACGTHIGGDEEELRTVVTSGVYDKVKVVNHVADDTENLVYMGTTSFQTPVYLNRIAVEADLVITLGAGAHHVMAGFGGGRKSILPGIAGTETIKHNHAYSLSPDAFITNPKIGNGVLEDNPLNLDMLEAAAMLPNLFVITMVMNAEMELFTIFSGHYYTSWKRACDEVNAIYRVPIQEKADVIIASCGGYPKDMSLYQGTKTVDNLISGLKKGGKLILFLEGRDGGGSPDYFDWIGPLVKG
ncbi:MAG: nickel-dependent lactate racemase, partial [Spirochaetales bacterium]|nr:nickel-dependent lactate racemase [Candidatus Physcosoma equi]